eukprot:g15778.t1
MCVVEKKPIFGKHLCQSAAVEKRCPLLRKEGETGRVARYWNSSGCCVLAIAAERKEAFLTDKSLLPEGRYQDQRVNWRHRIEKELSPFMLTRKQCHRLPFDFFDTERFQLWEARRRRLEQHDDPKQAPAASSHEDTESSDYSDDDGATSPDSHDEEEFEKHSPWPCTVAVGDWFLDKLLPALARDEEQRKKRQLYSLIRMNRMALKTFAWV